MDKKYWETFYKNRLAVNYPSPFAEYCLQNHIPPGSNILELGSGSGRDAFYFAENQLNVVAVDQSSEVMDLEAMKLEVTSIKDRLCIVKGDFVRMDYASHSDINVIYSRFTMHAITDEEETIVLRKSYDVLPVDGMFLIEVRTTKDSLFGVGEHKGGNAYFIDHYRRFIDSQEFLRSVIDIGFEVLYFIESDGLSKYKDEDPVLMRIVLRKV